MALVGRMVTVKMLIIIVHFMIVMCVNYPVCKQFVVCVCVGYLHCS